MRAYRTVLIAAAVLSGGPVLAQSMGGDMKGMSGMARKAAPMKTGQGVGVITAIDPKAGKLTIKHGPIPSVGWPAMTMAFRANPKTLLKGLRVGQKIGFDVKTQGMAAEVTSLRVR